MISVVSLWIPILISAVIVFFVSAVIHMLLPYHRTDFRKLPSEDEVMAALRSFHIAPGDYEMPWAGTPKERSAPEFLEKTKRGPAALLTVAPSGGPNMGKLLLYWFLYCIVVSVFAAYVAGRAVAPGGPYLSVFRFAGCTAFAGYSLALLQNSIWFGRAWSSTFKSILDGLIYTALTAGCFGWLWPE